MVLKAILQDIKKLETEAVIVGFHEDVRPLKGLAGEVDWLLCGALSGLLLNNKLRGSLGDVALLTSQDKIPSQKIFLVGLGSKRDFSFESLRSAAKNAASSALGAGITHAALEYFHSPGLPHAAQIKAIRDGLADAARGRSFAVSLLISDAAVYEKISHVMKG